MIKDKVYLFEPCDLLEKAVANMLTYLSLDCEANLSLKHLLELVRNANGKTLFILDTDHISDAFLQGLTSARSEDVSFILLIQPDYRLPYPPSTQKIIALEKPFLMDEIKNALRKLSFFHKNNQNKYT